MHADFREVAYIQNVGDKYYALWFFLTLYLSAQFGCFPKELKISEYKKRNYFKCNEAVDCNKHYLSLSYTEVGTF